MLEMVVGVAVGVLILAAALFPVIDQATTTEKTFKNNGYYTLDKVDDTTQCVISWDSTSPSILSFDDIDVDMSTLPSQSYTIVGSDTLVLRYYKTGNDVYIQCYGSSYASSTGGTVTITIDNGTLTFTAVSPENVTTTTTYSDIGTDCYMFNADNSGEYAAVMKYSDAAAYMNGDSKITFIGTSITNYSSAIAAYGTGSIDDGVTITTLYKPNNVTTVTYSDIQIVDTAMSNYLDLYKLDKVTFKLSRDGSPTDITYSYFIVPNEVTAELAVHASQDEIELLETIPVLITVGLIMGIVGVVAARRFE